ncbi:MAG: hypothetical protein Q7U64_14305 [Desulfocapsaceae bacterium]|nr:hypothetical protein [Desulfocapsaceae bacterium]
MGKPAYQAGGRKRAVALLGKVFGRCRSSKPAGMPRFSWQVHWPPASYHGVGCGGERWVVMDFFATPLAAHPKHCIN